MQTQDDVLLLSVAAPIVGRTVGDSLHERFGVHRQDEHLVEQVDEPAEVPRPAAEEGDVIYVVLDDRRDSVDVPDVVLVRMRISSVACLRVTLLSEFPIAVDGFVATPAQLVPDRALARARAAFDEVVAFRHQSIL